MKLYQLLLIWYSGKLHAKWTLAFSPVRCRHKNGMWQSGRWADRLVFGLDSPVSLSPTIFHVSTHWLMPNPPEYIKSIWLYEFFLGRIMSSIAKDWSRALAESHTDQFWTIFIKNWWFSINILTKNYSTFSTWLHILYIFGTDKLWNSE